MHKHIDTARILTDQLSKLARELETMKDPKSRADIACRLAGAAKELEHLKKAKRKNWEILFGTLMVTFFLWGYVKSVLDPIYERESKIAKLEAEIGHSQVARLREDVASEKKLLNNRHTFVVTLEDRLVKQHDTIEEQTQKIITLLSSHANNITDPMLAKQLTSSVATLENAVSDVKSSREEFFSTEKKRQDLVLMQPRQRTISIDEGLIEVQIYNRGRYPVNLKGWSVTDNSGTKSPLDQIGELPAGANATSQLKASTDVPSDNNNVVNLLNPHGKIVDSLVTISSSP